MLPSVSKVLLDIENLENDLLEQNRPFPSARKSSEILNSSMTSENKEPQKSNGNGSKGHAHSHSPSDNTKILPRYRYCNEIDELFHENSMSSLNRHLNLEARSMNSFLSRVRTFPKEWPFSESLHPFDLAGNGWRCVTGTIIQCTEDVNKTLVICDNSTTIESLIKKLTLKGCTFSFKPCPVEKYKEIVNFYTTISYKNLVKNHDIIDDTIIQFLKKRYDQFDLIMLSLRTKAFYNRNFFKETWVKIYPGFPDYFGKRETQIKSNLRRIYHVIYGLDADLQHFNDRFPMIAFILLCILFGWSIKNLEKISVTSGSDSSPLVINKTPILFCFLTGNTINFIDCLTRKTEFHQIWSHYSWSPWRDGKQAFEIFKHVTVNFPGNHDKTNSGDSQNNTNPLETSSLSISDSYTGLDCNTNLHFTSTSDKNDEKSSIKEKDSTSNHSITRVKSNSVLAHIQNPQVTKFMKTMSNINRKKRKQLQLAAQQDNNIIINNNGQTMLNMSLDLNKSIEIDQGNDNPLSNIKRQKTLEDFDRKINKCNFLCNESLGKGTYSLNESCEFLNETI